jgi:lysophospholipase L1-like esterase
VVDRRVLFFGESFVAGVGDPAGLGWVGRVVASSFAAGVPLTAYNLGVRGETSLQTAERWPAEADPRTRAPAAYGVVFCVGVNDTTEEDGRVRVERDLSVDALGRMLDGAARRGLSALVVGPAPACEPAQDDRIRALSAAFAHLAAQRKIAFVEVLDALRAHTAWTLEAAGGDGVHPGAGGYAELARLVFAGGWLDWLEAVGGGRPDQ